MKDIEPVNLDLTPFKEPQGIRDYHVSRPLGDSLDSPNHPLWGDVSPRSYPEKLKIANFTGKMASLREASKTGLTYVCAG